MSTLPATFVPMEAAVAAIRPVDTLAIPLGPGAPGGFLHSLGNDTPEDRFSDLKVFGALLPDLYAIFARPSVHLKSGFLVRLKDSCVTPEPMSILCQPTFVVSNRHLLI